MSGNVLALRGTTVRVLTRNRPFSHGPLIPSPDGSHVAFVAYGITCCTTQNSGIWSFNRDGTNEHQIVGIPPSPCGNQGTIGSVAWAPDGQRLAYTVFVASDALSGCGPGVRDIMGSWVTPYVHPQPRQLTFEAASQADTPLSWSPDGHLLAVNGEGGVRAIDALTGTTKFTLRGGRQGVFAPRTGTLAYLTGGVKAGQLTVIRAVGAGGLHPHLLATVRQNMPAFETQLLVWSHDGRSISYLTDTGTLIHMNEWNPGIRTLWVAGAISHQARALVIDPKGSISSPVWSPDGASLAYLGYCRCGAATASGGGSAIWSVNVTGGAPHLLLNPASSGARGSTSSFSALAWLP